MQLLINLIFPSISYLIGSIPFGFVLVKAIKGVDIREFGSKNVGATNTWRVAGKGFGITAFVFDMLKGFGPVFVVSRVYERFAHTYPNDTVVINKELLAMICGIAAILGHVFPVYLKLRGGKAAATSCGVFMFLAPHALLIAIVVWVITVCVSKFVSLGTMFASIAFAVSVIFMADGPFKEGISLSIFSIVMSIVIIFLHRSNIKRIIEGSENKIGGTKKRKDE